MFEVGWGGLESVQGRVSLLFLLNKCVQKGSKNYYFSKFTFLYTFLVYSYINIL